MKRILAAVALLGACAPAPVAGPQDSVVPGTIRMMVRQHQAQVVVAAVGKDSPAAQRGVRAGDVVLRYNGEAVSSARQFYRLVVDSAPGSTARLELLRDGAARVVELPVDELDTMPGV